MVRIVLRLSSLNIFINVSFTDDPEYQRAFAALEELDLCSLKSVFKEKRFRVLNFSSLQSTDCTG